MILRKLHKSALMAALSLVASSCELEETVYSSIFTETFYRTASDAEKGLLGAYSAMGSLYGGPAAVLVPDYSADQVYPRAVVCRNTLTLFTVEPTYTTQKSQGRVNESPQQIWSASYSGIEKANWVIARVPDASMDENRRKQIIGEALFLRAFYHWTLTKNFGDVPVRIAPSTSEDQAYKAKSPSKEVYQQIYADLDQAYASGLPSYPNIQPGRPSKEAVNTLYAKAALYNEDWATALAKAESVLQAGTYRLSATIRALYDHTKEDDNRAENIWAYEADPISPGNGHQLVGLCGPPGSAGAEYARTSYGSMFAYMDFFNAFAPGDARRTMLDTSYVNKSGAVVPQNKITPITPHAVLIKKYMDPASITGTVCNIPILRLADVYLIAAEAEARLNGPTPKAYEYVNIVRKRAGLGALPQGLSKEAFVDAVIRERAFEFFAEGDRWYDLARTGTFMTVIPKAVNDVYPARTVQPKNRFFPIPQDEINANPLITQNPDWD